MLSIKKNTSKPYRIIYRVLTLCLSMVLTVTVFSTYNMRASANASMSSISVKWANPQRLKKINKTEKWAELTANVNGTATKFYISFPAEGGIRVCTDTKGYFEPSSLLSINYYDLADGSMLLDAGNAAVRLNYGVYPWTMEFYNAAGKVSHTVTSRQMYFGYKNDVLRKVKLEGTVSPGEMIYGFGERYNSVNQVGKTVKLWNMDTGYHQVSATDEKQLSYTNVPILNSSKGYTVFFNSYYGAYADIGDTNPEAWTLDFNGTDFDFYVYTETAVKNIQSYTNLTGKPFTAPKWAFGYWVGATSSYWLSGATKDEMVKDTLEKYKSRGTMPSAIYLESYPFEESWLDIANSYGVHALAWNNPSITLLKNQETGLSNLSLNNLKSLLPNIAEELLPAPFLISGGRADYWGDFSNPNMVDALKNGGYTKLIGNGLSGVMVDYGEYIEEGMKFYNGMTGDEMHNYYPVVYNQTLNKIFSDYKKNDFILFARAGSAGSQAYAASFGGDQGATFDGLKQAYYGGISINASGFANWGSDIGSLYGDCSTQLYLRWLQFGAFSPLMRTHGDSERNPWSFGKIGENTFDMLYWTRNSLIDYIYSANLEAGKNGTPMMQSMAMAFPNENNLASVENQYLFGSELLVCPVLEENVTYLDVKFPDGYWTDLWNGKTYEGGIATVGAPLNTIPVYLRDGAVIKATVSSDFSITGNMNDKSYDALIAAPSTKKHTALFHADNNNSYTFTNSPDGEDSFTVTNNDNYKSDIVIAVGVTASAVEVNGKSLKKFETLPTNSSVTGYYIDYDTRRTVIFTGGDWKNVSVTDSNMALKNLCLDAVVTGNSDYLSEQMESILDGDPTSQWMIHSVEDSNTVIDLGETKQINKLVVTWGAYSPVSYKLEISEDLNGPWKNINNSVAIGGEETYKISGQKIRYIRISEVEKDQSETVSPVLVDVAAYSNDLVEETIKTIAEYPPENNYNENINTTDPHQTNNGDDNPTEDIITKRRKKVVVVDDGYVLSTTAIVLIIVGSVLALAGVTVTVIFIIRRKKRKSLIS